MSNPFQNNPDPEPVSIETPREAEAAVAQAQIQPLHDRVLGNIRRVLPHEYDGIELDYAVVSYVLQLAVRAGESQESERLNDLKEELKNVSRGGFGEY